MRDIIFRAKFKNITNGNVIWQHATVGEKCNPMGYLRISNWEQYTGLKDKDGNKIFEGDIISDEHWIEEISMENPYWFSNLNVNHRESEILGNIHDNPELLQ